MCSRTDVSVKRRVEVQIFHTSRKRLTADGAYFEMKQWRKKLN